MALLQIAEPGQSTLPHQHKLAVGIDLGTTNSLVATVQSGLPIILKDINEQKLIPSIVYYSKSEMLSQLPGYFESKNNLNSAIKVTRELNFIEKIEQHINDALIEIM